MELSYHGPKALHKRRACKGVLSQKEIIGLLKAGVYEIDPVTCEFRSGGKVIKPWVGPEDGRAWCRLYHQGKRKQILRARLVWMSQTLCVVPKNWEVHHQDSDPRNDSWDNLLCLHQVDHRKVHQDCRQEELPF